MVRLEFNVYYDLGSSTAVAKCAVIRCADYALTGVILKLQEQHSISGNFNSQTIFLASLVTYIASKASNFPKHNLSTVA